MSSCDKNGTTLKAPKSEDPGKCNKAVSANADSEVKGVTGPVGKARQAKDKLSFPFGKSKCSEEYSKDSAPRKKYTLKDRIKDIKDGFAEISKNRKDKKEQRCKAVGTPSSGGGGEGRRMIYPYTLSAKIAQFPFRYYYDNVWLFKYFIFGIVASFPLFFYLGRKSYSPENVAEWKKNREELFGLRDHNHKNLDPS